MGPGAQLFNFCVRERSAEAGRLDMRARALVGRDISMASTTTKGIVVSFGNTPQAQNDDNLRVYEEGGVQNLDVMGNDLGGNAKSLFALDSGRDLGSDPLRPKQLLTQDGIGEINFSKLGAKIWITANGTVGYDYSNVSDLVTNVNALAAGETITDSFIYSIRLANGTLSWATATVKLTGVNDAASVLLNASKTTGGVFEDSNVEATGWVKFKDADTSQDGLAQLVTAGTASHGTYKVDADGTWHYQVNNADNAVQALAVGQTMTDKFTVKSLDGTASTVVTITITGLPAGKKGPARCGCGRGRPCRRSVWVVAGRHEAKQLHQGTLGGTRMLGSSGPWIASGMPSGNFFQPLENMHLLTSPRRGRREIGGYAPPKVGHIPR